MMRRDTLTAGALGVPVGRLVRTGEWWGEGEMKMTQVEYRKLVTHGDYQNTTIGATALVGEGDTGAETLDALRAWVTDGLQTETGGTDRVRALRDQEYEIAQRIGEARRQLDRLRRQWEQVVPILEAHGIAVGDAPRFEIEGDVDAVDEIPF